jgi:N-acyl-D-amino-acid deacylase
MTYQLVIRGGTIADGTGGPLFQADVAVEDGRIAAVGPDVATGAEEIDADGLLVTPGFVDIHTHYDGQVTWESRMSPSSSHGVTTIVTGNCGVGFAPCRPEDRESLISLMAGVEDIPEVVMAEGLPWDWESFPDYLDAVGSRPHDIDVAAMLPHSALRVYVMGRRAVDREKASLADITEMARLTDEAISAGAIGFGTSRALQQRSATGEPIPTVRAAEEELAGILGVLRERNTGVFQLLSDFDQFHGIDAEWDMLQRLVDASGRPMSFTLNQKHSIPDGWRRILDLAEAAADEGLPINAQVLGRPTGLLLGHDLTSNPFKGCPTYESLRSLSFDARIAQLRETSIRAQILDEMKPSMANQWDYRFELCDPPNYEPEAAASLSARARREGTTPEELAYDVLLEDGGRRLLLHAFQNYATGSLDACYEMLTSPHSILGLGDGGAHCGLLCDASYPTTMLAFWARDRTRGPRLGVAEVVRSLTSSTADAVGLADRGRVACGNKADLNVIDFEQLHSCLPRVTRDLPAGGRRVVQDAVGYVATIVSGVAIQRDDHPTGSLPGRLIRGAQAAPTLAHAEV